MSTPFRYELSGISDAIARLKKAGTDIEREIDAELQAGVKKMERKAVSLVPVDEGRLRGAIGTDKAGRLDYFVAAQTIYAAFVEFGTRKKVQVPSELQKYAAQFKGQAGTNKANARTAIYGWLKRKGVPKEKWGAIYWAIMRNGTAPHPFMYPAFVAERGPLAKRVAAVIKKPR